MIKVSFSQSIHYFDETIVISYTSFLVNPWAKLISAKNAEVLG